MFVIKVKIKVASGNYALCIRIFWQPTLYPPKVGWFYIFTKMSANEELTITCSHLVADEL